jgi:type IV pilus assembly protein PilB
MHGSVSPEILQLIPAEFARRRKVVPLELTDGFLKVGLCNPDDWQLLSDLEFLAGKPVQAVALSDDEVSQLLKKIYGGDPLDIASPDEAHGEFQVVEKAAPVGDRQPVSASSRRAVDDQKATPAGLRNEVDESSIISLVNEIITQAIDRHASDIHIEAYEQQFRVRYRLDGVLQEVMHPPIAKKQAIISRLKIMADLDIAEKRRPQDGRIRVQRLVSLSNQRLVSLSNQRLVSLSNQRGNKVIDLRVSTLPTDFGEKIVLRILDKSQLNLDLEKLGLDNMALQSFKQAIASPHGMILVTGPTGSGKTTTLYATLNFLNSPERNILTIEDPIEYNLDGINQSQVKSDIGYTFARALRSFLRQDPDIIMVGEIRDQETAEIAVRAALTGHLVLSTLHTNDAPSALTRLLDMGLEPFLISSSVKMVIAQRLVRKICEHCKIVNQQFLETFNWFGLDKATWENQPLFKGQGCERCNHTGYRGRTAVFEVMPMSASIAGMINRRATAHEFKEQACREGMQTLRQSAIAKLMQGTTTVEEVLRETEA